MKKTKWILLCVLFLSTLLTDLNAQNSWKKTPDERGALIVEGYNKSITLTSQQKEIVLVLATKFAQKCDSINMLDSLTLIERVNLKKDEHSHMISSIENLLTENQKKKLKSKQDELKALIDTKNKKKANN